MPRRWLQIHLLTAVVAMLTASVLVFVNLQYFGAEWRSLADSWSNSAPSGDGKPRAIVAKNRIYVRVSARGAKTDTLEIAVLDGRPSQPGGPGTTYQWRQISGNDLKLPPEHLVKDRIGIRVYEEGHYEFELIVSANGQTSMPAKVEVDVIEGDPPVPATPREIVTAAGISVLIVVIVCVFCELFLRRRKSLRPDPQVVSPPVES